MKMTLPPCLKARGAADGPVLHVLASVGGAFSRGRQNGFPAPCVFHW
jgi:hypothetical protein